MEYDSADVLLSSAESVFHAVDAPNVGRRGTLGRGRKQDRRTGANPETRATERSVRQVDWRVLSAHRWVRQRASHSRRTPQVTDHGLLSERK